MSCVFISCKFIYSVRRTTWNIAKRFREKFFFENNDHANVYSPGQRQKPLCGKSFFFL